MIKTKYLLIIDDIKTQKYLNLDKFSVDDFINILTSNLPYYLFYYFYEYNF